jgi:hypothetical protein
VAAITAGVVRPSSRANAAALILSAFAALAIVVTLARAPEFFSSTAAPFLALAGSGIGALVAAFSLVRRPRP